MKPTHRAKKPPKQAVYSEEAIENQILNFLHSQGVSVEKVSSEGYYSEKKGIYMKRKSTYSRAGTSDIHGVIEPNGRALFIEVKRPEEMKFFDRPVEVLQEELLKAMYDKKLSKSSISRYNHAWEQAWYIEDKLMKGAVAFYASSTNQTIEKLRAFGIEVA